MPRERRFKGKAAIPQKFLSEKYLALKAAQRRIARLRLHSESEEILRRAQALHTEMESFNDAVYGALEGGAG